MATRDEFLKLLWTDVVNPALAGHWIDNTIRGSERDPDGAFADVGLALKRLREAGANDRDLNLVARLCAYEAVFQLLYMLDDPGVDNGDVLGLQEELLDADPLEGR